MEQKNKVQTLCNKIGSIFGTVFVGCIMAIIVALTIKIISLIF